VALRPGTNDVKATGTGAMVVGGSPVEKLHAVNHSVRRGGGGHVAFRSGIF
jgi:hypothetical protein